MKTPGLDVAKPCIVVDKDGNVYSAIPDKSGWGKRKLMLELKPSNSNYVFPSKATAYSAINHTIEFLKRNNIFMDKEHHLFVKEI